MTEASSYRSGQLFSNQSPPQAPPKPYAQHHHGQLLVDDWHWLRDPHYPEVKSAPILDYLKAENTYFDAVLGKHQAFVDALYAELVARQADEDEGVPYREGDYLYQWRFTKGAQHKSWWRCRTNDPAADWILLLDETLLAEGQQNFVLGGLSVSPCGRYLAYATDTQGAERYCIRIKDLVSGALLDDVIHNTDDTLCWAADSGAFVYIALNDQWRPYQAKVHRLQEGTQTDADTVLYEEPSAAFFVHLGQTTSREWLIISAGDHETNEIRLLPAADVWAKPRLLPPRTKGQYFDVDHGGGRLWIRTNDTHQNYRLASVALGEQEDEQEPSAWREEIAADETTYLLGVQSFQDFYVLKARQDGLVRMSIHPYQGDSHQIHWPEAVFDVALGENRQYQSESLRFVYSSLVSPTRVLDYHIKTRRLACRKVQQIPSGYDSSAYVCERLWVNARDGERVPVSLVRPKDLPLDGSSRLYLYGYGAYGHVVSPAFRASWLSLLERGFVCAIAHTRGGADLGHQWYERGKLAQRTNTFNDFVDVAHHLVEAGYTQAGRIAIAGGSAGGELMGAVVNQVPTLWGAVVAHVPFVDVLNTMLDESLPLTPMEWPEWGNPITDPEAFAYIRSYSPFDQTQACDYPPMLVTGGLHDPRVTYWEPAKWVARLRWLKTDRNILLLKTEMDAGHQGRSGRYDALNEQAETWAFILLAMDDDASQ